MGTAFNVIARLLAIVIAQPGVRDLMSTVARRAAQQATVAVVRAINRGSKTRKTVQSMR